MIPAHDILELLAQLSPQLSSTVRLSAVEPSFIHGGNIIADPNFEDDESVDLSEDFTHDIPAEKPSKTDDKTGLSARKANKLSSPAPLWDDFNDDEPTEAMIEMEMTLSDSIPLTPQWTLQHSNEPIEHISENIQALVRFLLQGHSLKIPSNISGKVLLAHLPMLAPELSIDLLALCTKVLAEDVAETYFTLEDFVDDVVECQRFQQERDQQKDIFEEQLNRINHTEKVENSDIPAWDVGYDSHIGRRKAWSSQTNQDNFYFDFYKNCSIFLVADGISVSTAGSGDIASRIAVTVTRHFWERQKEEFCQMRTIDRQQAIYRILDNINYNIFESAKETAGGDISDKIPMGTTAVLALTVGTEVIIASMGDSRIYGRLKSGLVQLTGDQNVRGEKLRHNYQLENENDGFALIRYLGRFSEQSNEADMLPPDIRIFQILPGECLLLCTDGLTDYINPSLAVTNKTLLDAMNEDDPMETAWKLITAANRGGGGDNITLVYSRLTALSIEDEHA